MSGNDYYGAPQPPAYTPGGQQSYYQTPSPGGHPQQQQYGSGFPPGGAPQASAYAGYPPQVQDTKLAMGTPYYDPYGPQQQQQQQVVQQQQYYGSPAPQQQQYGTYPTPPQGTPYSPQHTASPYHSPQLPQTGYYPPPQQQVSDYYGSPAPPDGSRGVGGGAANYGYVATPQYGTPVEYHQQPAYHQQQGAYDPYAPSGPGAYADGSQGGYGAGEGQPGERGMGSTLVGGAAGAFIGKRLGLGAIGGAAGGAILANVLNKKKKHH